jgi:hypothetical protein
MPQPGVYDRTYDDIMREAKEALRFGGSLSEKLQLPVVDKPAPASKSLWDRVKDVANYSPLPEDIGDQFANAVDNPRDRGEGFGSVVKSGLAGAGKGFLDLLRSTGTPAGLATLGTPESSLGKLAAGAGSAVFTGEGVENFGREGATGGERALGAAQTLMGLLGLHGAATSPHAGGNVNEGRFSKPYSPADAFNGEPVAPPVSPSRHPVDLFDTPEFTGAPTHEPAPAPVQEFAPFIDNEQPAVSQSNKPRVSAQEFADILAGRQKFQSNNPDAQLAPGLRDELDRSGLEYGRTQRELKKLLGMPDADPAEVGRMKQGARELGSRLRKTAKSAVEPPPTPEEPQLPPEREGHFKLPKPAVIPPESVQNELLAGTDARMERRGINMGRAEGERRTLSPDQAARISREMDAVAATPSAGGDSIPSVADSPQFQAEFGPVGDESWLSNERGSIDPALLRMLARPVIGAGVGAAFGDPEHRGRDTAIGAGLGALTGAVSPERLRYASMLTGLAQAKNVVGDIGVVGHTAAERALTHGVGEGGNVLKEFFSPRTGREYLDMLKGEKEVSLNRLDRPESVSSEGITGLPFRTMGAADTATQNALTRAGVPDAANRTFTGDPQTDVSKAAMQFQRKGGALARFIVPFLKTAANQTEASVLPVRDLLTRMPELSPEEQKQVLAKIGLLGAGGAAGAAYGSTEFSDNHPKTTALLTAMMGPVAVPAALGAAASGSVRHDRNPLQTLRAVSKAAFDQLPLPSDWIDDPTLAVKSLAPAGLDMLNPDDTPRDTSHGIFDALISRIPFLSRTLPAKSSGKKTHHRYTSE